MTVLLPFVPEPMPDEILGSWLARVAAQNERGAWTAFVESMGYPRRYLDFSYFGHPRWDYRLDTLLQGLGSSYESAVRKLSTVPYWLLFDSDVERRFFDHTSGEAPAARSRLWMSPHELRVQFCPLCIAWDSKEHGLPYWHRAHQLPNVFVCAEHHCTLEFACAACGAAVHYDRALIAEPLSATCRCGADLAGAVRPFKGAAAYVRLAALSQEVMLSQGPSLPKRAVAAYLRSLGIRGALNGSYQLTLREGFHSKSIEFPLSLRPDASTAGVRELCAILAALNLSIDTALPAIAAQHITPKRAYTRIQTVDEAKVFLMRVGAKTYDPDRPLQDWTKPYWLLRLRDPKWLKQNFPYLRLEALPSIHQDRRTLMQAFGSKRRQAVLQTAAATRARLRDIEWLGRLGVSRKRGFATTTSERKDRVQRVKSALSELLAEGVRPRRISSVVLGRAARLTRGQIGDLLSSNGALKKALDTANDTWPYRAIRWAVMRQLEQGLTVTKGRTLELSGVFRSAQSAAMFVEIAAELDEEGLLDHQRHVWGVRDSRPYASGRTKRLLLCGLPSEMDAFRRHCLANKLQPTDVAYSLIAKYLEKQTKTRRRSR